MDDDKQFNAMVDRCLKAHEAVIENGTPAMIALTRGLLLQVGQELLQREQRRKQLLHEAEVEARRNATDGSHGK